MSTDATLVHGTPPYIGRFAPSPSGPLHFGSLLAAVASYVDAKQHNGKWLLRVEDIDEHRTVTGAEAAIQHCLEAHGLLWDGEVHYQTTRQERYSEALYQLARDNRIFYCDCNRQQLRALGAVYSGTCKHRKQIDYVKATKHRPANYAVRFNIGATTPSSIRFTDRILGEQQYDTQAIGDFIIRRRDSLFAYQLAVSVDDIDQQISHVVRGADLLASTPWQIALINSLQATPPKYAHLPLLTHAHNTDKLSKQTAAKALKNADAARNIAQVLSMLNQPLPDRPRQCSAIELLEYAAKHWEISHIPKKKIPLKDG